MLQVLPRLASWGNLHKRRSPSRELEDEYDRITNDIEALADTNPGHKNRRKKISYWSEDEERLVTNGRCFSMEVYYKHLSFRLLRDKIFKNEARADFVTSWRPQTTFGYKNDFDFAQYQKSLRKRMSSLYSNSYMDKKLYAFDNHPHPQIMIKY